MRHASTLILAAAVAAFASLAPAQSPGLSLAPTAVAFSPQVPTPALPPTPPVTPVDPVVVETARVKSLTGRIKANQQGRAAREKSLLDAQGRANLDAIRAEVASLKSEVDKLEAAVAADEASLAAPAIPPVPAKTP